MVNQDLAEAVYQTIANIPYGRVTTYGAIAQSVGLIRGARQIGWMMHAIPEELDLPCHRVVNSQGFLSGGWNFGHPDVMRERLLEEGVPFAAEYRVAIKKCLWVPGFDDDSAAPDEVHDLDFIPG